MTNSTELSLSRTWRLALKELKEILRDRRTIATLVLMPLLLYPLMGVMVKRGLLSSVQTTNTASFRIAIESGEEVAHSIRELTAGSLLLPPKPEPETAAVDNPLAELTPAATSEKPPAEHFYQTDPGYTVESEVRSGNADLGVRIEPVESGPAGIGTGLRWTIIRREGSALSDQAYEYVIRRLEALNEQRIQEALAASGIVIPPRAVIAEQAVSADSSPPSPLITFIPLVLVLMTMTGAVYPAIDLTAGERERGTMEILVAAPVPRLSLLAGKFVAVLVVALLTASVNMVSMFATLFTLGLDGAILGGSGLRVIPLVMLMMVVFAGFFSAVLLSLTSIARSFKEAQAYLIPLMLISLTPGVFSLMPDLQMGPLLAVTPLVNIVLTGRDLLQGSFHLLTFTIVILSTTFYGITALAVAARVFGSDSVLYGSTGSWTGLFRSAGERRPFAPPSVALFSLAIVFPLFIVVGTIPSRLGQSLALDLSQILLLNIVVFLAVFVAVPFVMLRLSQVSLSSGLALNPRVPAFSLLAAALFGISMWAVLYELNLMVGIDSRSESIRQIMKSVVEGLQQTPLAIKLAALAIAPALCEELFFRGFLQTSLRQRYSAIVSILTSAILFGLFHIIVRDQLFLERMIPSTLMGIILGILLERSGSLYPGMLLHALHNGLLICLVHYKTQLEQLGIGLEERIHLPLMWFAPAVAVALAAAALLWSTRPVRPAADGSSVS